MDCNTFQSELPDLILTPGATPSVAAAAHMKACPPCTEEYLSFSKTLAVLDAWTAPEPTPYFDQKVAVRIREEQAAPAMGWFERLQTRLLLNTGHNFRPAMAGALALALLIGGGGLAGINRFGAHQAMQPSATVMDLQILDHNQQAFQQMDELQQDEESGSQNNEDMEQATPPVS